MKRGVWLLLSLFSPFANEFLLEGTHCSFEGGSALTTG